MDGDIALIELGDFHAETLHSQVRFLQWGGFRVHLLVTTDLEASLPPTGADVVEVLPSLRRWRDRPRALWRLRRYLADHGLRRAVLNTAEGARVRDFCLGAGWGVDVIGVVHNARKLVGGSVTQWWISRRVRRYLVLADYIVESLESAGYEEPVRSFYPAFYPYRGGTPPARDPGTLRVCIPGNMRFQRRDYAGLREALSRGRVDERIRLLFLGDADRDDGPRIRSLFEPWTERGICRFWRGFVEPRAFYEEVAACDLILPLIHPSTPLFENYLTYQISGTFPLAFAFARPMLLHAAFGSLEDFRSSSLFYEEPDLLSVLNGLPERRSRLRELSRSIASMDKLRFEHQAARYVDFVREGGAPPAPGDSDVRGCRS